MEAELLRLRLNHPPRPELEDREPQEREPPPERKPPRPPSTRPAARRRREQCLSSISVTSSLCHSALELETKVIQRFAKILQSLL